MADEISDSDKRGTLLIVEDEPELARILTRMLEPYADRILTANDGAEGLKLIRSGEIDAVISDINMPVMSGLQMLAEVRQLVMLTPVVILTAFGDKENMREALRLDATDFLDKPFDQDHLVKVMRKALEFGLALRQMEIDVELMFQKLDMPADKLARSKQIKRVTEGMRIAHTLYVKDNG